jgi:thiol-disulfide isomerase/thioredoxin
VPTAISLGPILIPVFMLGLLTSLFSTTWVLGRLAPRLNFDAPWIKRIVEQSFLVGIVAARAGFVARYWESYLDAPWTIVYIWQPGYSIGIGFTAAVMFAAWRIQQFQSLLHRSSQLLLSSGLLIGFVTFSLVIGLSWAFSDRSSTRSVTAIKDFTLQDLEGKTVRWSDLEGNGTILNFWATWCPPCIREMPLLDQTNQNYKSQGINIVGISVGESIDTVRNFVDSIGITYPIWVDSAENASKKTQEIFELYGGTGLPTTIFVDSESVIQDVYLGELSRGYIDSQVQKLFSVNN